MRTIAPGLSAELAPSRARARAYLELAKPRLNALVIFATLVGFVLGSRDSFQGMILLNTLIGTAFIAAGAAALNQWIERDADARMRRTWDRPLPSRRLQPVEALRFGVFSTTLGVLGLLGGAPPLACLLAMATWAIYLFLYTPLKRISAANTVVGAIPGALPALVGWAAARGNLGVESFVIFGIVFFWQFPHFYAIAWLYREDYERGGFKMLSGLDRGDVWTGRCMALGGIALLAVSVLPTTLGLAGNVYLIGAIVLGATFLAFSLLCLFRDVDQFARRAFLASVIYLPLLLALMTLDKI